MINITNDRINFNNLEEKMKFTLLKMRDIITNSTNNGFKANYSIIYMLLEAKYYIVAGVNLDKAKELFKNTEKKNRYQNNFVNQSGCDILKTAVIVGENAGGKSNFIDSLSFFFIVLSTSTFTSFFISTLIFFLVGKI